MRKLVAIMVITILSASVGGFANPLREGFLAPPEAARPWVYWFIMDGNLSRVGITADLESMKSVGIGGVILMEVSVDIPRGPVEFMSDRWCALFKHAVLEAERLGLQITLNAGPGWTGSGGPWVSVEQSMQHLVASEVEVTGPSRFNEVLPIPEPYPVYFGETHLPEEILQARKEFYVDVAVLAFPSTDAPRLEDIEEKALYVREPYTSKPGVKPYFPALASYPAQASGEAISTRRIIDLSDQLRSDGNLKWEVPEGDWTILRFGRRTTGANTRPAPQPGLGFESDKFDRAALDVHFDAFVGKLLRTIGPRPLDRTAGWTMLHIDSWEMGSQNWSHSFAEEFRRRRGYDPLSYLPCLTGRIVESVEISERFLWDMRLTAQELVIENHVSYLKELGRQHGFGLSVEPYDMNPTADLTLGGVADVPMCEFWSEGYGFDSAFTCFESVSVAHTLGRPIVAAEAFTAGSDEAWKLFPAAMKNQGDWALCTGINRIVFHRFAHQPWLDRKPGMTMGPYGVHWDRTQTWWSMVSAYHLYLARCQFLLRQGSPVADICYLAPEGSPHVFRPPPSALQGKPGDRRGYNFDGCAPEVLLDHATVDNGKILFPGGAAYSVLVLPQFDTMTPALLHKIEGLIGSGAAVIGPPPLKSPSLSGYPECDQEILACVSAIWGTTSSPTTLVERNVGKGRIEWANDLRSTGGGLYPDYEPTAQLLAQAGVLPDFEATGPIRFIHRRAAEADIYFVANWEGKSVEADCTFRVLNRRPTLWDPVTGQMEQPLQHQVREGRTVVPLRFEPHQSFFVVFPSTSQGEPDSLAGRANFPQLEELSTLTSHWDVSFDPYWGGSGTKQFVSLEDWSKREEPDIRHYSGVAVYSQTFDLPGQASCSSQKLFLDLGEVHNMARVRLNGQDLGVVWCAPWRVDISSAVTAQNNRLEIEVANLWPNRLIGDSALPKDQQFSWTTWNPYKPDDPLLPSGLLGPVRLLSVE